MWHYTEGITNYDPVWPNHGIRILPGPSSLWLDATGKRLPVPLFPGFDTLGTLEHIVTTGHDHTWFVLDQKIIEKYGYEYAARSNGQSWDKADQVGLNALKAAGAKVVTASAEMQAEARKRAGPIIQDWIKKAEEKHKGLNAKAVLDEFHAELKKAAAAK